ncbi:hypothetical protein MMC07_008982 [Pseudocyphellaria aurata]|nr:hypothetical protein [Pseudocyphellaria aurata]
MFTLSPVKELELLSGASLRAHNKSLRRIRPTEKPLLVEVKEIEAEVNQSTVPSPSAIPTRSSNLDLDAQFWRESTGNVLALMLQKAGYSTQALQYHLFFFCNYVAPAMGRRPGLDGRPRRWQSFMTDDFTPVELSWSWKEGDTLPSVRYAIEPIGPWAGTTFDPLNMLAATDCIRKSQGALSGLNLEWLKFFSQELIASDAENFDLRSSANSDILGSQMFTAYDLGDEKTTLKAYFIPTLKAKLAGQSNFQLIRSSMDKLIIQQPSLASSFAVLSQWLDSRQDEDRIDAEIVAIDCVQSSKSRIKIYVRSRLTSFDSVTDVMTMGGLLENEGTSKALASLKELWGLVLGLRPDFSTSAPLESSGHRTAGILYYFELKPGADLPTSKVYIPAKHYGVNDLEVARGLSGFLKARGNGFANDDYFEGVQKVL